MKQLPLPSNVCRLDHSGPCGTRIVPCLAAACVVLFISSVPAFAQIDPLLFMKTVKPNVIFVVDVSPRMQRDAPTDPANSRATSNYYDPALYSKGTNTTAEGTLGVTTSNTVSKYRRKYDGFIPISSTAKIEITGDLQTAAYASFEAPTRMALARAAITRAIQLNQNVARFGLIAMRQRNPTIPSAGNSGPIVNAYGPQSVPGTTEASAGKWYVSVPTVPVGQANGAQTSITAPLVSVSDTSYSSVLSVLAKDTRTSGCLLPAGSEDASSVDAPVKFMLDDAKSAANALITSSTDTAKAGRNTVIVLIVGGGEGTTAGQPDLATAAGTFTNVSGRRVPIYVIAIAPPSADVAKLQDVATNSGGQYYEVTKAAIDTALASPGTYPSPVSGTVLVPQFVRAINIAIQHTFATTTDFDTAPTASMPYGPQTEYQVTSPIVGTVDLANGYAMDGSELGPAIEQTNGNKIPQRSNVMVTTAVAVPGPISTPGFPGRLRAFRVYRPEPDATKTSGYKFVGDGKALWVARTPTAAEGARNIYTVLPDGTMTPFTTDNAAALAQYLNVPDTGAASLISYIRSLPLGAFIDTTPAFLDAPSLDPPPDAAYPGFVSDCKDRRTMIFIGGNDGMLHAIDGRTGVEAWAFIPSNLLPKLRALREGQPVGSFRFFADGSPKVADVKINGEWRTYMVFGEGPGGTFYQTLDVTMKDMGTSVKHDQDDLLNLLTYFSDPSRITFKWSFPLYADFEYKSLPASDFSYTNALYTYSSPYGDLKKSATDLEKSVGQTWSDPAVGEVQNASGNYVVLVGSGFLPYSQQMQPNRGGPNAAINAGTTFYVFDIATGKLLSSKDVGTDTIAETIDDCSVTADVTKNNAAGNCTRQKNALQSDPVATGPPNSRFVNLAYIGDLDGRLWRMTLGLGNDDQATITGGPSKLFDAGSGQPLYSSMAVVNVGGTQQYVFLGSGSDLLPSTGVSQSYNLFGVLDQAGALVTRPTFTIPLSKVGSGADEKVSAYPAVAGDIVFFTTTTYNSVSPWLAPTANVYALTFIGGPAYDNNGDNTVTNKDTPKVATLAGAGRATAPFVSDQHLVIGAGGQLKVFGDPQDFNNGVGQVGVRILSWRELR